MTKILPPWLPAPCAKVAPAPAPSGYDTFATTTITSEDEKRDIFGSDPGESSASAWSSSSTASTENENTPGKSDNAMAQSEVRSSPEGVAAAGEAFDEKESGYFTDTTTGTLEDEATYLLGRTPDAIPPPSPPAIPTGWAKIKETVLQGLWAILNAFKKFGHTVMTLHNKIWGKDDGWEQTLDDAQQQTHQAVDNITDNCKKEIRGMLPKEQPVAAKFFVDAMGWLRQFFAGAWENVVKAKDWVIESIENAVSQLLDCISQLARSAESSIRLLFSKLSA